MCKCQIRAIVLQVLDELVVNDIIASPNRKRRQEAAKGYVFNYSMVADWEKHEEEKVLRKKSMEKSKEKEILMNIKENM